MQHEEGFEIICSQCSFLYNALPGRGNRENKEIIESVHCKDCNIVTHVKVSDPPTYKSIVLKQSFFEKLFSKNVKYEEIEVKSVETPFEDQCCPKCNGKNIVKWDGKCLVCSGNMKIKENHY